ncbi:restriction endonuclease subunit S [Mesorhizobium sp.]|uniref:restriction endonuclease subunit S n=1 Tax=Mesorhizobium sp. TaxID=1871066 RepID=UPI000FE65925|nr:restriction endonuclease subunit S [Mesorhizobium sp.]RWA73650.1 MAG: restriction endonuclease subunit S [Mesorhizobium sp.]
MTAAWPKAPMREIAPLVRRPIFPKAEELYQEIGIRSFGKGVFHKAPTTGLDIGDKRVFAVEPGDLLFNIVFAWEGATAVATEAERGMIGSHRFLTCVPDSTEADARFLKYWFAHADGREQLLQASPGGAGRNRTLGTEKLAAIRVPLPPLAEQRRIVMRVEALAAKVEEARGLRERSVDGAKTLATSAAARALEDLTRTAPRLDLRSLVTVRGGGTPSKDAPHFWGGEIPWITPKDMKRRTLTDAIDHITKLATEKSPAKLVEPGAVLVVVRGMILAHTFPSAILQAPAAINQDMKALTPDHRVMPEYLCAVLWAWNPRMLELVDRSGHDTRKLNTDKLLAFQIPVPSIQVQKRVIAELAALQAKLDSVKALQSETATELDTMLPAILDRAFKGEL